MAIYEFQTPQYRDALSLYDDVLQTYRGDALRNMLESKAAQGTLRAGGIMDYPALEIERSIGQQRAQYAGQLATREADVETQKKMAADAFERQKEMFNRQIAAQKELMREQFELMKQAQGDPWQNWLTGLGQNILGAGVGALVGGPIAAAGMFSRGLVGGFKPMPTNIGGINLATGMGMPTDYYGQQFWLQNMNQLGMDPMTLAILQMMSNMKNVTTPVTGGTSGT